MKIPTKPTGKRLTTNEQKLYQNIIEYFDETPRNEWNKEDFSSYAFNITNRFSRSHLESFYEFYTSENSKGKNKMGSSNFDTDDNVCSDDNNDHDYYPNNDDFSDNDTIDPSDLETEILSYASPTSCDPHEINYEDIRNKIDDYRKNILKKKRLYDPLWYYIIDHSGQHVPTKNLLGELREIIPKDISFEVQETPEKLSELFDKLETNSNLNSVIIDNEEENDIRDLWRNIRKHLSKPKHRLSEASHMYKNVLPHFENIFNDDNWQLDCGDTSLLSSSERRNLGRDPQTRAKIGQKCDMILFSNRLGWLPELLIGEVSGSILPQCSSCKSWQDKIKLIIGLRDVLVRLENELPGMDQTVYGVQVVGYKLKIYAMVSHGGLFHLMLLYECYLPASLDEMCNIEHVWNVLKTLYIKVKVLEVNLLTLNQKKQKNHRKRNLASITNSITGNTKNHPSTRTQPLVINTPINKR
ncbi:20972_t:CDS:2, partial [Cetraspora pellucida]